MERCARFKIDPLWQHSSREQRNLDCVPEGVKAWKLLLLLHSLWSDWGLPCLPMTVPHWDHFHFILHNNISMNNGYYNTLIIFISIPHQKNLWLLIASNFSFHFNLPPCVFTWLLRGSLSHRGKSIGRFFLFSIFGQTSILISFEKVKLFYSLVT